MGQIIKYPFRVKFGGKYYPPNSPIKVSDATEHVAQGAVVIGQTETVDDERPARGRKPRADTKK